MGTRRKKRRAKAAPKQKRATVQARKRAPSLKRRPRASRSTRDWRSNPSTRTSIVQALKSVAGSLAKRLTRAPLSSEETVYLRGIANLKLGKRPSQAQTLALLAAMRQGSPLYRTVFGKREEKLVEAFQKKANKLALKKTRTPSAIAKYFGKEFAWGIAMQLADAHSTGKRIWYKTGALTQMWTVESFRRFLANPAYKGRREKVFGKGAFYMAHPDRKGAFPKRGRTRLKIT